MIYKLRNAPDFNQILRNFFLKYRGLTTMDATQSADRSHGSCILASKIFIVHGIAGMAYKAIVQILQPFR